MEKEKLLDFPDLQELFARIEKKKNNAPPHRQVVKLVTTMWSDKKGLHLKCDLITLKRRSFAYQCLDDEASNIGAETIQKIINLHECEDGIYEVIMCNIEMGWEEGYRTNYAEDWDFKLIPITPESEAEFQKELAEYKKRAKEDAKKFSETPKGDT